MNDLFFTQLTLSALLTDAREVAFAHIVDLHLPVASLVPVVLVAPAAI